METPVHVMATIKVVPQSRAHSVSTTASTIPRKILIAKEKAHILMAGEVPIHHCRNPNKSRVDTVKLMPFEKLKQAVLCWIIKKDNPNFDHPNWNGFMKYLHSEKNKEPSHID